MVTNKIFLDTNIIADIIDTNRPSHNQAVEVLQQLILQNAQIFISEDMITTIFYILKDKRVTLEFLEEVVFVDWSVLTFGKSVLEIGVRLSLEKNLDLEDVLQCLCAKENNCDVFITNDKKFYDCGIKIMTAEEFLL